MRSETLKCGRGRWRRTTRRGAAVVELAVVTPILLLMMFGIMEFGWTFMMRETMTNAVREAARVRVLQGSTDADARTRFVNAMSGTGLQVTGSNLSITKVGDVFTCTASIPRSQVSLVGIGTMLQNLMRMFNSNADITSGNIVVSCSMRQEGTT
jgi:Flp pilus assembly protein TadG